MGVFFGGGGGEFAYVLNEESQMAWINLAPVFHPVEIFHGNLETKVLKEIFRRK